MNIESLNLVENVACMMGILPTLCIHNGVRIKDYFRGITYITIFAALVLLEYYGKFFVLKDTIHPTVLWTNVFSDLTVTTINILGIFLINIRNGNKFRVFVETLEKLEIFIVNRSIIRKEKYNLIFRFVFFNLGIFTFISIGAIMITSSLGFDMYKYFALKDLQNFHVFLTSFTASEYCSMIGKRMNDLNQHLELIESNRNVVHGTSDGGGELFQMDTNKIAIKRGNVDVKAISIAFTTISKSIDYFNQVFGPLFVVYSCNVVANILVPLNMALLYSRGIPIYNKYAFGPEIVIFCMVWLIIPVFCAFKLFSTCGIVEMETRKVPQICYNLIQNLSDDDFKLRDELERYANQADRLRPTFSAAGFFAINFGLILPVLGAGVTYIIVLMQFHTLNEY